MVNPADSGSQPTESTQQTSTSTPRHMARPRSHRCPAQKSLCSVDETSHGHVTAQRRRRRLNYGDLSRSAANLFGHGRLSKQISLRRRRRRRIDHHFHHHHRRHGHTHTHARVEFSAFPTISIRQWENRVSTWENMEQ